jgi:hypothetical protein
MTTRGLILFYTVLVVAPLSFFLSLSIWVASKIISLIGASQTFEDWIDANQGIEKFIDAQGRKD